MDKRIEQLKIETENALNEASRNFPELRLSEHGLALFLGKNYAHPLGRILMLGLNPGLLKDKPGGTLLTDYAHSYDLLTSNVLIGSPSDFEAKRVRYWRNARRCFGATPSLQAAMELATYSFCCPFRTPKWSTLTAMQKHSLETYSRPVLSKILNDCQPLVIIVAGEDARKIVFRSGILTCSEMSTDQHGTKWSMFGARASWGAVTVAQLRHFSYFNSIEELQRCGEWLSQVLSDVV